MWALYKKEISSFLNSLVGYVVIAVFLVLNGLFLWIFSNQMNVMEMGYASLDGLFSLAPWVFMFLIPAITMRMLSEEKRTRTLELLLTRPISDFRIVLSKYLAGLTLVVVALIPTLVYYVTVHYLGETIGNIDRGGTMGSYLGLLFLAASYVAMGIFSSSLSENQIVSFLLAVVLCFFMFTGWESISSFSQLGSLESVFINLGINEHYRSLSRGLIDSRDLVYFVVFVLVFLMSTVTVLKSRRW